MFPCAQCGACCRQGEALALLGLPVVDGQCAHLDDDGRCSIYAQRPDVCRVDRMLQQARIPREQGYRATAAMCNKLAGETVVTEEALRASL